MAKVLRRLAAPLLLVAVEAGVAIVGIAGLAPPVLAQNGWFPFFNGGQHRPFFQPQQQAPQQQYQWQWWQQQQAPQRREQREQRETVDFSKAPAPRKVETPPTTHVTVMGDSMADWLAYGLEDAFGETPEIGVVRKNRAGRGLILGSSKNEYDWAAVARETLAAEKPDFVVMMIGLADRQPIRVRAAQPAKPGQKTAQPAQKPDAKPDPLSPSPDQTDPAAAELQDAPPAGDEKAAATDSGTATSSTYEFRSEKWAEAYAKRVDEVIAALKSKGAPVFWVGLPAIRGTRATSDMVYLNEIYRGRVEKAGIIYVDIWDGFVDENGTFAPHGPDFEGQTRRLRTGDGVHFTQAGARKLAHYVEREIRRVMLAHGAPIAMPSPEEPQPQIPSIKPGTPVTRPVAGPVVPLTATPTGGSETLLGGGPPRAPGGDPLATKVLVKGEPVPSLRGRADDFAWPRQDGMPVASMGVAGPEAAAPVQASVTSEAPADAAAQPPAAATAPGTAAPAAAPGTNVGTPPVAPTKPKRPAAAKPPQSILPPFFGGDTPRPPATINNNNNNNNNNNGNGRAAFWPWGGR
ncbi:MAG TPA: SGNH family hydrolase [Xanthobacteraceae bacterium]|nr:SGNH family hydrolase [Xanthobacteraceae bacterium]